MKERVLGGGPCPEAGGGCRISTGLAPRANILPTRKHEPSQTAARGANRHVPRLGRLGRGGGISPNKHEARNQRGRSSDTVRTGILQRCSRGSRSIWQSLESFMVQQGVISSISSQEHSHISYLRLNLKHSRRRCSKGGHPLCSPLDRVAPTCSTAARNQESSARIFSTTLHSRDVPLARFQALVRTSERSPTLSH